MNLDQNTNHNRQGGRRRLTKKAALVAAGSVSVMGILGGGIAFATGTVPGSGGVINACYQNHSGSLRVVIANQGDSASDHGGPGGCRNDETPISWNHTGPQGPQGATGTTGAQGAQGAQGPQGANGANGAQGPQGVNGAQGPQGAQGANGPQGAQGPSGTSNINVQTSSYTVPGNDSLTGLSAACHAGQVATGGGVSFLPGSSGAFITEDSPTAFAPNSPPNGWAGGLNNTNSLAQTLTVYAVCVTP